jgi:hypothetical protein
MKMYRYESFDCDNDSLHNLGVKLELNQYNVIKKTKCGVRINDFSLRGKFINLSAKKQWVCETPEKALDSFIARKDRQLGILKNQLSHVEKAIKLADDMKNGINR